MTTTDTHPSCKQCGVDLTRDEERWGTCDDCAGGFVPCDKSST